MKKIWNYISNLGIDKKAGTLNRKSFVLSNQLNFVMLITMLLLFIATCLFLILTHNPMKYGTLRIIVLFAASFLNLIAAALGFLQISRISLVFLPTIIFLLGPTLIGYVEEESYTYYPYIVIGASILPHILLNPRDEKFLYWFAFTFYFVLLLTIDRIMVRFGTVHYLIVDRIDTFYVFYKIAQVALFLFINACIYYLQTLNTRNEEVLSRKNNELDRQNKELRAQKEKIEEQKDELVNKEISTWQKLVSIISHEIVNSAIPLTNLAGLTGQMLEDESGRVLKPGQIGEETTADIHQSLKIIESRTQALINFVKATKSLTQVPRPTMRRISAKELLDRIAVLYHARFKECNVRFMTSVIPADLSLYADLELIEQVIINLVQNSLEAMSDTPGPVLSISASTDPSGKVIISISDNGAGISNEALERIFLPFYSTKKGKSGIGLSLSQQIMKLHNGSIEVTSGIDKKGTEFSMIFLPSHNQ